ncbi:MAG: FtsX-like permease family protein [Gemmatimonadota bacterium]
MRQLFSPVADAFRRYWGTSLLLIISAAAALAATTPVTWFASHESAPALTLVSAAISDLGMHWSANATTPAATQQAAISGLYRLLLVAALAALALAALTVLSIGAARASARATELAIRRAVGASRRTLFGSAMIEGVVTGAIALLVGGLVGVVGARSAAAAWPGSVSGSTMSLSLRLALAITAVVLLAALLQLLASTGRRVTERPPKPLELYIPALQLGMGLTVLVASGMILREAQRVLEHGRHAPGSGWIFHLAVPDSSREERSRQYQLLLSQLHHTAGIEVASLTSPGANTGLGMVDAVTTDCGFCSDGGVFLKWHAVFTTHQFVSADTFSALGLAVIEGRGITSGDDWNAEPIALVSAGLARKHFQKGEAIGRQVRLDLNGSRWYTVVGVVDDRAPVGFGTGVQPVSTVYLSVLQQPPTQAELLVRSTSSTDSLGAVQRILRSSVHPGDISRSTSEHELFSAESRPFTWFGDRFRLLGWTMLAITLLGTFVLMKLWVTSLLPELGLRRAMGAKRPHVLVFVLIRAAATGIAGIGIGLWFGPALWDSLPDILRDIPPWDASIVAPFAALLVAIAGLGALFPAIHAVGATPAELIGKDG